MTDDTPQPRFAGDPERLDREGLLALVRDLQRTVVLQQQTIARQREGATDTSPIARSPADAGSTASRSGESVMPDRGGRPPGPVGRTALRPVVGVDYTLVFDGGSLGNPGRGYGSYQIVDRTGSVVAEDRLEYGDMVTNNGAEFRTLIAGLERLSHILGDAVGQSRIAVRGDSQLVIHGVTGQWKIKHADLKPLKERAATLLSAFGSRDVAWHGRNHSVRALGH